MKKQTTRMLSLLCMLALLLTLLVPAFAEEPQPAPPDAPEQGEWVEVSVDTFKAAAMADAPQTTADDSQAILKHLMDSIERLDAEISIAQWNIPATEAGKKRVQDLMKTALQETTNGSFVGRYYYYGAGSIYTMIKPEYAPNAAQKAAEIEKAVQEILRNVSDSMPAEQKALILHDYLATHIVYDLETLNGQGDNYDVYSALIERTCVCEGYARAYKLLMTRCGIPCGFVQSNKLNHIWNEIQLDGKWYQVDVTWDDPVPDKVGFADHEYFLRDDKGIGHTAADGSIDWVYSYPCTDTTRYDNAFWKDTEAPVVFHGSAAYHIEWAEPRAALYKYENNTDTKLHDVGLWSSGGSGYYIGSFSGLSSDGTRLYWNDGQRIYRWKIGSAAKPETAYTLPDKSTRIWGSAYQDGEMKIACSPTGPTSGLTTQTVTLAPIPNPKDQVSKPVVSVNPAIPQDTPDEKETVEAVKNALSTVETPDASLVDTYAGETLQKGETLTLQYILTAVKQTAKAIEEFTVDVTPVLKKADGSVQEVAGKDLIIDKNEGFLFRLPIPAALAQAVNRVAVLHEGEKLAVCAIQGRNTAAPYVEVTTPGFSAFTVQKTTESIPGDVTDDGKVTVGDLVKVKRFILGLDKEIDKAAADVNKDGKITVGDLVKIKRYILGLDKTL